MKKILITKDQKTIPVNEAAAKILLKTGWRIAESSAEILKQKVTIEPPEEVKVLIRSKKEAVAVKDEIVEPAIIEDVIAEPEKAAEIVEKPKRTRKKK